MPLELQVIRANEFIRWDAQARLDFEASKNVLQDLARACRKRGLDRAMLDLRSLPVPSKPHFTTRELAALVMTFQEAGFSRQQRLAILYRSDVFGGIRNFAFISRMRGLKVQAFTDFEASFQWLSEGTESVSETHKEEEVAVPVTKSQNQFKRVRVNATAGEPGMRRARGSSRP